MHRELPGSSRLKGDLSGLSNTEVRSLVSKHFRDLNNGGVPHDALKELGKGLRSRYPGLYER